MVLYKILISGFVATAVMTLFSYLVSHFRSEQFREPELLNSLISQSAIINLKPSKNHFLGWLIHYFIGWSFVVIFHFIWTYSELTTGIVSGSLLGFLAGIIGIFSWKALFKLNQNPPEIDFSQFYFQLLIAHILFGISVAVVYSYF